MVCSIESRLVRVPLHDLQTLRQQFLSHILHWVDVLFAVVIWVRDLGEEDSFDNVPFISGVKAVVVDRRVNSLLKRLRHRNIRYKDL